MKNFSYLGDDAATPATTPAKKGGSFDYASFVEKVAPEVVTAATSAIQKKDDKKPGEAPTDSTGKKPSGSSDSSGSFLTSTPVLVVGGVGVLGVLGYFLLRRK